jgi:hypothetical protein
VLKRVPVAGRGTVKRKGSFDEGTMDLKLGLDTDDAGQILMKTALNSDNDYSFKVTTQSGDKYYFQAQVTSFKVGIGGADDWTTASAARADDQLARHRHRRIAGGLIAAARRQEQRAR